jgi:hypothetical protein
MIACFSLELMSRNVIMSSVFLRSVQWHRDRLLISKNLQWVSAKNISMGERSMMADLLGMQVVGCHDRCLGLLCVISGNKRAIFSNIKERVW